MAPSTDSEADQASASAAAFRRQWLWLGTHPSLVRKLSRIGAVLLALAMLSGLVYASRQRQLHASEAGGAALLEQARPTLGLNPSLSLTATALWTLLRPTPVAPLPSTGDGGLARLQTSVVPKLASTRATPSATVTSTSTPTATPTLTAPSTPQRVPTPVSLVVQWTWPAIAEINDSFVVRLQLSEGETIDVRLEPITGDQAGYTERPFTLGTPGVPIARGFGEGSRAYAVAHMAASSDLEIVPTGAVRHSFMSGSASWQWSVTPSVAGGRDLLLGVDIVYVNDSGQDSEPHQVWVGSLPVTIEQPAVPSWQLKWVAAIGGIAALALQLPLVLRRRALVLPLVAQVVSPTHFDVMLRIGRPTEQGYPVEVLNSPVGESERISYREKGTLASESGRHSSGFRLRGVAHDDRPFLPWERAGDVLGGFLFPDEVSEIVRRSLDLARVEERRLRIRLRIDAFELGGLPWECATMRGQDLAIGLRRDLRVVRYVGSDLAIDKVSMPRPVRLLVATASPKGMPPVSTERELAIIREATSDQQRDGVIELADLAKATPLSLTEKVADWRPHVMHFVGHGYVTESGTGALVLEDGHGGRDDLTAHELVAIAQGTAMRMAVLNACDSVSGVPEEFDLMGTAEKLARMGLPAVIAMQEAVRDDIALVFAGRLYGRLAAGVPVDDAITEARIAALVAADGRPRWGMPVLFMRAPHGHLWR